METSPFIENPGYWLQQFNSEHGSHLSLGEYLGSGLMGDVYAVTVPPLYKLFSPFKGGPLVIKIMRTDRELPTKGNISGKVPACERPKREYYYTQEIAMMKELKDSEYIMPLLAHSSFTDDDEKFHDDPECHRVYILLMPRMLSLYEYWENRNKELKPFTEKDLVDIAKDLSQALADCHSHEILHRDLKDRNIYVRTNPDGSKRYILADFGCSRSFRNNPDTFVTRIGNPYTPPNEPPAFKKYTSDVYTLGRMLCYLFTNNAQENSASQLDALTPRFRNFLLKTMARKEDRYQNGSEMVQALKNVTGSTGTVIADATYYRRAKLALKSGNLEMAAKHAADGVARHEQACDLMHLYFRIRKNIRTGADLNVLGEEADDLYENTNHPGFLCLSAIVFNYCGRTDRARADMMQSAEEGYIPAKYLYGRMLLDDPASDQNARTDGLDWICQAAGSGYWSALRFLNENKDFYPLPTRILNFIDSESDFSEDAARRYDSLVNSL